MGRPQGWSIIIRRVELVGLLALFVVAVILSVFPVTSASSGIVQTHTDWRPAAVAIPAKVVGNTRYNVADAASASLGNGTFRVYYSNYTEPVNQYNTQFSPDIYSAITNDGIHWKIEHGVRLHGCPVFPPSAFPLSGGRILLYTACGLYKSSDGLNFTPTNQSLNRQIDPAALMTDVPNIVSTDKGIYRMYQAFMYNNSDPQFGPDHSEFRTFSYISSDGVNFAREPGVRINGTLPFQGYKNGGHPIVYHLANGTWIMYFKADTVPLPPPAQPPQASENVGIAVSNDGLKWRVTGLTPAQGEPYSVITTNTGATYMIVAAYYVPGSFQPQGFAAFYAIPGDSMYMNEPYYYISTSSANYSVGVRTLSTISSWTFNSTLKQITFKVATMSQSFLNITYSSPVLSGSLAVRVDGSEVIPVIKSNATGTSVYVSYAGGNHTITVAGSSSIVGPSTSTSSSTTSSTTTTTTTSTTTTTTSTTSSTTTRTATSQTSTTTPSSTSTTTVTPTSTQTTTSSATQGGGGGIPEFPYQILAATLFTFLLVASYLLARRYVIPGGKVRKS